MNNNRLLMTYAPIAGLIVLFCLCMIFGGKVSLSMNGFAVDKDDCLYIGKDSAIVVYKNDELLRTSNPKTSRSYVFTILNGDIILLSTSTNVYTMDLYGNVLSEKPDEMTKVFNQLQKDKKEFVSVNEEIFRMKNKWGRTYIVNDANVLYKMPLTDYIVRILLCGVFVSVWIFVPIIVFFNRKKEIS